MSVSESDVLKECASVRDRCSAVRTIRRRGIPSGGHEPGKGIDQEDKIGHVMSQMPELLKSLSEICAELRRTAKIESAEFFSSRWRIIGDANNAPPVVKDAIQELATCRPMAQYADFSMAEERLLEVVVSDATACLSGD